MSVLLLLLLLLGRLRASGRRRWKHGVRIGSGSRGAVGGGGGGAGSWAPLLLLLLLLVLDVLLLHVLERLLRLLNLLELVLPLLLVDRAPRQLLRLLLLLHEQDLRLLPVHVLQHLVVHTLCAGQAQSGKVTVCT